MRYVLVAAAFAVSFFMSGILSAPTFADDNGTTATKAWARATPPSAKVGAAFVTVHSMNGDRLIGVASPVAKRVEIHTHIEENGVMKMIHVKEGVDIPKSGMVMLKPGGFHVMLMGLKGPLVEGTLFPITLTFDQAGDIDVMAKVLPISAKSAGDADGDHSH